MSGEAGEGSPGGGVEVQDFQSRMKRFQKQDQQLHQQQVRAHGLPGHTGHLRTVGHLRTWVTLAYWALRDCGTPVDKGYLGM